MKLEVFKGVEKEPKVTLSFKESDSGIYVVIVGEDGSTLNHLCHFNKSGTLRLISSVGSEFGFQLDKCGRIVIEDKE